MTNILNNRLFYIYTSKQKLIMINKMIPSKNASYSCEGCRVDGPVFGNTIPIEWLLLCRIIRH